MNVSNLLITSSIFPPPVLENSEQRKQMLLPTQNPEQKIDAAQTLIISLFSWTPHLESYIFY